MHTDWNTIKYYFKMKYLPQGIKYANLIDTSLYSANIQNTSKENKTKKSCPEDILKQHSIDMYNYYKLSIF